MKEIKNRKVLRHESGLFLSWSPDSMPLTTKLSQARRFIHTEDIIVFLENSYYAPENPDEFEIVDIEIEYRIKEEQIDVHDQ